MESLWPSDNIIALSSAPSGTTYGWGNIQKLYDTTLIRPNTRPSVRVFDIQNRFFIPQKLQDIIPLGTQPVYKITLWDGKTIKATPYSLFFIQGDIFSAFQDIVGLDTVYHTMSKIAFIGVNGHELYRDYEWMKQKRNEALFPGGGVIYIGQQAECSPHTIRKWLKIHNLKYSEKEKGLIRRVWNKGKFGYKLGTVITEEHKQKIREARSGEKSNWWKGGVPRTERKKIKDYCSSVRPRKLKEANYQCVQCSSKEKLELDHIIPVHENISLARDLNNLQILCRKCHCEKHKIRQELKLYREKNPQGRRTVKWVCIRSIEYCGIESVFSIKVLSDHQNCVMNKIIIR